jgi:hypothetical protein
MNITKKYMNEAILKRNQAIDKKFPYKKNDLGAKYVNGK